MPNLQTADDSGISTCSLGIGHRRGRAPETQSPFLLILVHYRTAYAFYSVLFLCSTEKQFNEQCHFPDGNYIAPHSQMQHSFPFLATETEPEGL